MEIVFSNSKEKNWENTLIEKELTTLSIMMIPVKKRYKIWIVGGMWSRLFSLYPNKAKALLSFKDQSLNQAKSRCQEKRVQPECTYKPCQRKGLGVQIQPRSAVRFKGERKTGSKKCSPNTKNWENIGNIEAWTEQRPTTSFVL